MLAQSLDKFCSALHQEMTNHIFTSSITNSCPVFCTPLVLPVLGLAQCKGSQSLGKVFTAFFILCLFSCAHPTCWVYNRELQKFLGFTVNSSSRNSRVICQFKLKKFPRFTANSSSRNSRGFLQIQAQEIPMGYCSSGSGVCLPQAPLLMLSHPEGISTAPV